MEAVSASPSMSSACTRTMWSKQCFWSLSYMLNQPLTSRTSKPALAAADMLAPFLPRPPLVGAGRSLVVVVGVGGKRCKSTLRPIF